jgi:hypothetical protein
MSKYWNDVGEECSPPTWRAAKYPCSCHLCGARISNVNESHNPHPLVSLGYEVRCCAECNMGKVLPLRIMQFNEANPAEQQKEMDKMTEAELFETGGKSAADTLLTRKSARRRGSMKRERSTQQRRFKS